VRDPSDRKVVASVEPFAAIEDTDKNPVPDAVIGNAAEPAPADEGETVVIAGTGLITDTDTAALVAPLGAGFETEINNVRPTDISAVGTTAVREVEFTKFVTNDERPSLAVAP
jgi:hypothetical protein